MSDKERISNAALIRVHKTSNYTVMSNRHLFDKPPLSLKAKGLMSMFLAFPEDWNYSINGLVAICKESRDAIKSTMDELKKSGYLNIEKIMPGQSKSGKIEYIYHIYEEKKSGEQFGGEQGVQGVENPPLEFQEGENQPLEVQTLENQPLENQALEVQPLENPIQLNIKNENTNNEIIKNENTNNETIENVNIFGAVDLFNLYKNICKSFPQPRELSAERAKKAETRLSKYPAREFWQTVCEKAEKSSFCKKANWFSFDWIIKNNNNPLKVYEGNYDDNKFKSFNRNVVNFESGKYAKYHAEQNAAGGAHA